MPLPQPLAAALAIVVLVSSATAVTSIPETAVPSVVVQTTAEPIAPGPFEPTWESLANYEVPEWFRDAKFGIWAHWGPQCAPERGDWYARHMYSQGHAQYGAHLEQYGHPSEIGFKDVIHRWKAERWDPEKLVALYARAGAQYFFALANHHDNFDLWNSKYQPWNSVRLGPKKDLVAGWAAATRKHGLKFGVSVHSAHAWSWYETAQGADKEGPKAGVPYDGTLTAADGEGTWWEGLDPQDLYEQRHEPSPNFSDLASIHARWHWDNGVSQPDAAYCERFYNRTMDLINQHQPDLLYFDDSALPLWPVTDAGLKIAAHYYNQSARRNDGRPSVVIFGKILNEFQKRALVWDVERGAPNAIEPQPWQTCTCIGGWHYDRALYDRKGYRSAANVVRSLADIVSKNGNMLLSVPVRGDGTIDDQELAIVEAIATWMDVNREAIFATRPWKIFGEGPASSGAALSAQGFNEGKGKPFTPADVRFTTSKDGKILYAISLGWPTAPLAIGSLGTSAGHLNRAIARVELLGQPGVVRWQHSADALTIDPPADVPSSALSSAAVYRISLK